MHTYPVRQGCLSAGAQMLQSRLRPQPNPNVTGKTSASALEHTTRRFLMSQVLGCGLNKLPGKSRESLRHASPPTPCGRQTRHSIDIGRVRCVPCPLCWQYRKATPQTLPAKTQRVKAAASDGQSDRCQVTSQASAPRKRADGPKTAPIATWCRRRCRASRWSGKSASRSWSR